MALASKLGFRWSLLSLVLIGLTPCVHAGIWAQVGGSYIDANLDSGNQTTSQSVAMLDASLGYRFLPGFVFSAHYLRSADVPGTGSASSVGLKGGLLLRGFELTGSYFPWASSSYETEVDGAAFSVSAGYHWNIAGPLHIGLVGTYWVLNLDGDRQLRYWMPTFSLSAGW